MASQIVVVDGHSLSISDVEKVARKGYKAELAGVAQEKILMSRQLVEQLVDEGEVVYGITTGFGKFSDIAITKSQVKELQRNLIVSHACGIGKPFDREIVRGIMVLRANALAKGYSGVRLETVVMLLDMLNRGVHPVIPEQGSLGASGDLAPLAHMVLVMMGEGKAEYQGEVLNGQKALQMAGLKPLELAAKEGLALINGTQVMTSIGCLLMADAQMLALVADRAAALTIEALRGVTAAYDDKVQQVRNHPGQIAVATHLRTLLEGSKLVTAPGQLRVQDAYALRCIPQVHGATRDTIAHVKEVVVREINAATDNPLIFTEEKEVISAGNFHGQPIALCMDFLGIAMAEIANISERRVERLVNPQLSSLPAFLTEKGGLHSGLMIAQYAAASLVSENKGLAHPASVDSIPSSANQEDHVSMGTIAARQARNILHNVTYVLAIELLCAAQGVDFYRPQDLAPLTKGIYNKVRTLVSTLKEDRALHLDIEKIAAGIQSGYFNSELK